MPQTLYEFWTVATRPTTSRNEIGWSPNQCDIEIENLLRAFSLLTSSEADIFREGRRLVITHHVGGVASHDARLVAAMKLHNIEELLGFNTKDFARCSPQNIRVLDPSPIVASTL